MAKEQEVKFMMQGPESALQQLMSAGASPLNERTFEDNLLLDDSAKTLRTRGVLLRLRQYGEQATLTVKSGAAGVEGLKVKEEREVRVADFEETLAILKTLGYLPNFRYQKYRRNFDLEGTVASLDETPIGCFLEVEGEPEAIRAAAAKLGLTLAQGMTQSYRDLFRAFHPKGDMVFKDSR
jgi:adenylate cyclase, class 2